MKDFMDRFGFDPNKGLLVGVEREAFLTDNGEITPRTKFVLEEHEFKKRNQKGQFGYELSACQIESRIGPCCLDTLHSQLQLAEDTLVQALKTISYDETGLRAALADWLCDDPDDYQRVNLGLCYSEVGPEDMPLDVYPDSRYLEIVKTMPQNILLAACRVIGTHIHIGMPNHETALRVYNSVIPYTEELSKMGDGSGGERLAIYKVMAPDSDPPRYESWEDHYQTAVAKNFASDPRKCWTMIRISVHGTIEFRMFGATPDLDKIVGWATKCHELCSQAM